MTNTDGCFITTARTFHATVPASACKRCALSEAEAREGQADRPYVVTFKVGAHSLYCAMNQDELIHLMSRS